ncbi:DUF885 family protein [Ulvibacterium sp.]|uniref:DUF885 family protein n=1 Tax=Ulvibacterium sp. TaxID=2665914 RepID=UPI002610E3F2|nr:DUF885 family protein [Ulvibacterium sp.]
MNNKANKLIIVVLMAGGFLANAQSNTSYDQLVEFFKSFREFQKPALTDDGIPDYSDAAMDKKAIEFKQYREQMSAIDTTGWTIAKQADYYLVWAEMNAVDFHLNKYKPWKHDPGFYSFFGSGDAGSSMNLEGIMPVFFDFEGPLSKQQKKQIENGLKIVPKVLEQARTNLSDASGDFAEFAIRNLKEEVQFFNGMGEEMFSGNKKLDKLAKEASKAIEDYRQWILANKHKMTRPAGSGKEAFSWWNHKVQLSPWGWEESNTIIQREYDRAITFLKLEEQRNRDLPPLEVAMTQRAYNKSLRDALHFAIKWLDENEIMTIEDWANPRDYYWGGRGSAGELSELSDNPNDDVNKEFLPENSNVDLKYRQREILPGENHEYVGHMLDDQRQERLKVSPVQQVMGAPRFNMGSMRLEGWAVWMEECLMQAGFLDGRPRKGREMVYIMMASHMSLSVPDMKMHANEINLAEARQLCADITPRGWTRPDEGVVFFEMQSNLRNPGGFHNNVVTGKAYFMKMFRDYAVMKGEDFKVKEFIDDVLSYGIIPMPLIRWQMLGDDSEIRAISKS